MMRVKAYLIIVHFVGWLLFMTFPLLFLNGGQNNSALRLLQTPYYWLFGFTYAILFYSNAYLFIPRYFLKKAYFSYALIIVLLTIGISFLQPYDKLLQHGENHTARLIDQGPPPGFEDRQGGLPPPDGEPPGAREPGQYSPMNRPPLPPERTPGFGRRHGSTSYFPHFVDSTSLFIFLMIMALSAATRIITQWQITERRASKAEADKATAELSFLKAQINPHFFFNTLNNIYTLAVIKDENAPDSIMKLSNIMRYVTDDATGDFVPLQSEVNFINDYIELQRLRLGEKTTINFEASGYLTEQEIAPLILMTFVENVFKYGVSKHIKSDIAIPLIQHQTASISFAKTGSLKRARKIEAPVSVLPIPKSA